MKKAEQFTFIRDTERWLMVVNPDGEISIVTNGEERLYTIKEPIIRVEQSKENPEYVLVYVEDDKYPEKFYQFKFEEDHFLVGDIFYSSPDNDDDFIGSFAGWVFDELYK